MVKKDIIIAIPKGRILTELKSLFNKIGFIPEDNFFDEDSRKLVFSSNIAGVKIIKVRSFDVATFVRFGAADAGICGSDVLEEFSSSEVFPLIDLKIGKCRLSIAAKKDAHLDLKNRSHIRVASKYTNITNNYFSAQGIQDECIKLNGSMELAPHLKLCDLIVDLVSTGKTLQENNLEEIEKIMDVSSYFVVNKNSLKTKSQELKKIINLFDQY